MHEKKLVVLFLLSMAGALTLTVPPGTYRLYVESVGDRLYPYGDPVGPALQVEAGETVEGVEVLLR